MSDLRSGKEQLKDELAAMHRRMTDPVEIAERERRELTQGRIKERKKRYGL